MQWTVIDYFFAFIMEFTPGEAMAIGALVGMLPLLLLWVRRPARPPDDTEAVVDDSAPEPSAPSVYDRLLTCVICKHPVKMSAFKMHIAAHDTEGHVSSTHPPPESNGQSLRLTAPTKSPKPPTS